MWVCVGGPLVNPWFCQIGLFYTLPSELVDMSIQLPNLLYFIHSQDDTDTYSEAYIAISYDSVEYKMLLKKVNECVSVYNRLCVCICVCDSVLELGEVQGQPTQTGGLLQKQSHAQ